ncbi:unnamed protein product [Moneuplotes crassus]|uniref:Uncharacterized protein n=1 Tax=Euplotes crassus TaxID=5936 RepID=A0AAD1XNP2_EUPCR|nr:unnamed protein product [Moneuplotes crassus]
MKSYDILQIDFKKSSIKIQNEHELEQLKRIQTKIDQISEIYEQNQDLKNSVKTQTTKYLQRLKDIDTEQARLDAFELITKKAHGSFLAKIYESKDTDAHSQELYNKYSSIRMKNLMRFSFVGSYLTFIFGFCYFNNGILTNKLMKVGTFGCIGVLPSVLMAYLVHSQNNTDVVNLYLDSKA